MLFQKKVNRVVDEKKSAEQFKETMEKTPLEKKDLTALIIAALLVFIPALILVGGVFLLVIWLFFLR